MSASHGFVIHRMALFAAVVIVCFTIPAAQAQTQASCTFHVGCHLDGSRINSLHVFGGASTATVHFYDKFGLFHVFVTTPVFSRRKRDRRTVNKAADLFLRPHTYRLKMLATPHSKQRGFSRDVINPQNGHILCDRNPATSGFSLRIQWSSRSVTNPISKAKEILVMFTKRPFLAGSAST